MSGGAREAFDAFVAYASAVLPDGVVATGIPSGDTGGSVAFRPVALERVNRSRRAGPVLDLTLTVSVVCTGPAALDHLESLLVAVELSDGYSLLPASATSASTAFTAPTGASAAAASAVPALAAGPPGPVPAPGDLSARFGIPVAVDLEVRSGPPITEVPTLSMEQGRRMRGRVERPNGHPLSGALVRATTSGATAVTDAEGAFRILSDTASPQVFTVRWGGAAYDVTVDPQDDPVVLLCAPSQ